jgi:hypothetical protein
MMEIAEEDVNYLEISRRSVLRGIGAASVFAVLPQVAGTDPKLSRIATVQAAPSENTALRSANRWSIQESANNYTTIWTRPVAGTEILVDLRLGAVETVLSYVILRYHFEIAELRAGDVAGWRSLGATDLSDVRSNLSSGTAMEVRPSFFPRGISGGFSRLELERLRELLDPVKSIVSWGGDLRTPDESLFYISVPPANGNLERLTRTLRDNRGLVPGSRGVRG